MPLVVLTMSVPIADLGRCPIGGEESASPFNQSSSQQHALTKTYPTIVFLGLFGLLGDIEGPFDRGRQNHFQRLFGENVHTDMLGNFLFLTIETVNYLQKRPAVFNLVNRKSLWQTEIRDLKVFLARIGDHHRIVFGSEKGRIEIVFNSQGSPFFHIDECGSGKVRAGTLLHGQNRTQAGELHCRIGPMTRHGLVNSLWVVCFFCVHGANNGQLVHLPGQSRK